jgi:anti-sigma B factor antagonist
VKQSPPLQDMEATGAVPFTVVVEHLNGTMLVCPVGELDLATAPLLERVLETLVDQPPAIELDLTGLTFVDCGGLRPIRELLRRASYSFARVRVCGACPQVERVLTLTGLDRQLAAAE